MGLKTIHGFLLQPQVLSATWGVIRIRETCLIEMDSPLEDIVDVQAALPAYDFGVTPEPTFTIGLSFHPERSDLVLKSAPSVKEHTEGRPYWLVELEYETANFLNTSPPGAIGRIPTRVIDSTGTATPKQVVILPWQEPVIWHSSTRQVSSTRYKDSTGAPLVHANFLPLTEGIDLPLQLQVHQFTWNVQATGFNYKTDIDPYIGKINDSVVDDFYDAPIKHVFCESISCVENYRTTGVAIPAGQAGSNGTWHYITITAVFIIDDRTAEESPEGYFREANRRVSMHTQQLVAGAGGAVAYGPIPINNRGDLAKAPWPLRPDGTAYPFNLMNAADPETDFFIIDPLFPEEADLKGFIETHSLAIP